MKERGERTNTGKFKCEDCGGDPTRESKTILLGVTWTEGAPTRERF